MLHELVSLDDNRLASFFN